MMFGYGGAGGGWPVWGIALMWIGMLAVLGVLIWVGYTLMTSASRGSRQQRRGDQGDHERRHGADARGVLDERLARGEIDAAEYHRLRGLIAAGDDQAPAGSSGRR
jgi:uncharacterized membrane protein